jgi:hypothetical protein
LGDENVHRGYFGCTHLHALASRKPSMHTKAQGWDALIPLPCTQRQCSESKRPPDDRQASIACHAGLHARMTRASSAFALGAAANAAALDANKQVRNTLMPHVIGLSPGIISCAFQMV